MKSSNLSYFEQTIKIIRKGEGGRERERGKKRSGHAAKQLKRIHDYEKIINHKFRAARYLRREERKTKKNRRTIL